MRTLFGVQLQAMRMARGLSIKELALITPIDFTYLHKLESGRMDPPSTKFIHKLAKSLKVEEDELLLYSGRVPQRLCQYLLEGNVPLAVVLQVLAKKKLTADAYEKIIHYIERQQALV